ncbi:MAG TPA: aminopeptidase P N-terminal domain-containing protein [Bacteroidales bacterium]|nr:aminopeptidase P N-terminal domain-containing protein [Bacteroidales bacterium]
MKYLPLPGSIFTSHRQNFVRRMLPCSVAIFHSNDEQVRSGDQFFSFRQNPDFFYLTGIDQEKSVLMLFPDSPNPALREVLFLLETNEHIAIWEGHKYSKEEATATSGISKVEWLTMFESMVREAMSYAENVYLATIENPRYAGESDCRNLRFAHDLMRRYPLHKYHRAAPVLTSLRLVKSPGELDIILKAIEITSKAFLRVLRFVKPGVAEYEIEAEIIHEYLRNRASGHSFYPIVASGANACVLHYVKNNQVCRDGDLVLLDTGAEYANYAGDLSRTFPVNGRFSPRQKQVYNSCLKVMKEARSMLVQGTCIDAYHKEVIKIMENELLELGLLTKHDIENQDPTNPVVKKYFPHGTSHFMGLDVHDQGHRFETFKPGMLLSCEPGIYIRGEGIGIRIENNILITESGPRDLTANVPAEIEEIEEIMNS